MDPTKAGQSVREVGANPFIVGSPDREGNIFYGILRLRAERIEWLHRFDDLDPRIRNVFD
ncbi:MAG: hypothetical protein PHQ19_08380 [Candidatus Krumholzibacteria bacterium]|nr:hypothetical protein [Candidatus Krumholzibacteria bacterium]